MEQHENRIRIVQEKKEKSIKTKNRFIKNSIGSFPSLEKKYESWNKWLSEDKEYFELSPLDYYFFNMVRTHNKVIQICDSFLNEEIIYGEYLRRTNQCSGSFHQLNKYYNYLGRTQMRLKNDLLEEYQKEELLELDILPKGTKRWKKNLNHFIVKSQ